MITIFIEYNPNPKGLRVGDCTVRAICKLTGQSWDEVYSALCNEGFKRCDMPSSNDVWGGYLRELGFTRYAFPDRCPDCYTVIDFCKDHPKGKYLLALDKHAVTVDSGNYFDVWNCGHEAVNFAWTKERMD